MSDANITSDSSIQDLIPMAALKDEIRLLGPDHFLAAHPNPFMLYLSGPEDPTAVSPLSFHTIQTDHQTAYIDVAKAKGAVELKKSNRNPYESRISFGRATTTDIILRSSRVSKLHAYLTRESDKWHLFDAGSKNGTFLNNEKLNTNQGALLVDGDLVTLDKFVFIFMPTGSVIKTIEEIFAPKQA